MKKVLSVALASAMVLGMGANAFAIKQPHTISGKNDLGGRKTMKKVLSVALASAMVLGMGANAFAISYSTGSNDKATNRR